MKVLVTGAAGFIGAALCGRLLARGDRVTGLDSFSSYYDPSLKEARVAHFCRGDRFRLTRADLGDRAVLEEALRFRGAGPGRAPRRPGRSTPLLLAPGRLHSEQPRRLRQPARVLPPSWARARGLRVLELGLRCKRERAFLGSRRSRPSRLSLRRHQEGQRGDSAQLQPPLRAARDGPALLHRLRTLGASRHGLLQLHPQYPRRPADRGIQPRAQPAGLHLHRRCRRRDAPGAGSCSGTESATGTPSRPTLPPAGPRIASTTSAAGVR